MYDPVTTAFPDHSNFRQFTEAGVSAVETGGTRTFRFSAGFRAGRQYQGAPVATAAVRHHPPLEKTLALRRGLSSVKGPFLHSIRHRPPSMQRHELEHIIRACAALTGHAQFIVVGNLALLGQFPDPPDELVLSSEAELYCPGDPESTRLITRRLGELSLFDRTFHYCARGVEPEDIIVPEGWRDRLIPVESVDTAGATGFCLEVHDLAISKLAAGRDDDLAFVHGLLRYSFIDEGTLEDRLTATELPTLQRSECEGRFARLIRALTL
jgi:hypothetical protein